MKESNDPHVDHALDAHRAYFDSSILDGSSTPPDDPLRPPEGTSSESSDPLGPQPIPTNVRLQEDDPLREKERHLYSRSLEIYETLIESGDRKTQLAAVKEVVTNYHRRLDRDVRDRSPNPGTQILAIGTDALREALSRASRGLEGGLRHVQEASTNADVRHPQRNERRVADTQSSEGLSS